MSRLSRGVCLIAVLTISAVVLSTLPAGAQTREGLLLSGKASGNTAFLTTGMVEQATPPPPGGGGAPAQGFGIGAKIGPLWSSFDSATVGSTTVNFDTSTGWEGGIWFGGNRGGRVGVMGEVLYAKKKQEVAGQTGSSTSLKYLEIPILMRVNIGSRSRNGISVYGLVGPVFDVNLKAEANGVDVKKGYESLDIGILGGAGIEITRFLVEGRYNHGLRNVLKSTNVASATDIKTHSFALLFGVRFN